MRLSASRLTAEKYRQLVFPPYHSSITLHPMKKSTSPSSGTDWDFLLRLLSTHSPSGWESSGQACWRDYTAQPADRVETDAYGNVWATLEGSGPSHIMLAAHADEIGFIIRHIDDKGFISVGPIGGSDRTIARARRLRFFGSKGEVVGIIGNTAVHLRDKEKDKVPDWPELFVDVGASSATEVAGLGLRVGCPGVYLDEARQLPHDRLVGRAIDNRICGYLIARVLAELNRGKKNHAKVTAVNAVQEEIGGNGARMIAHRLRPDCALIFDVTHATDTPGIDARQHGSVKLGAGPTVAHGAANHPGVVEQLLAAAEKENLPVQHEAISRSTSTDADVVFISRDGIPTALVSIPLRYMHSPAELVDLRDVETAIKLVTAFIRGFKGIPFLEKFHGCALSQDA
jgi:putative aminopeptidase FrvX